MKVTKKQVKELLEAKKLASLIQYVITDGSKSDMVNALHILINTGSAEYKVSFESLPYSRGGKYARHASTLYSTQKWEVKENYEGSLYISTGSTSNSAACPSVNIPMFYTEIGRNFHNFQIESKIEKLKLKMI